MSIKSYNNISENLYDKLRNNEEVSDQLITGVLDEFTFDVLRLIYDYAQRLFEQDKDVEASIYFKIGNEVLKGLYYKKNEWFHPYC